MAGDEITRVRYFERQFLRAVDFRDEQRYHRDARRRHALGPHTWGIVSGLELVEVAAGGGGFVDVDLQPGVAIDGFGRELVNYHPLRLDAALFDAFHTTGHQTIWMGYEEDESGALSSGWADCQDSAATRTTESWRLFVSPPAPYTDEVVVDGVAAVPAPAPAGAPELPLDSSVAYQELPEASPGDRWLILLGVVRWDGTAQRFVPADADLIAETKRRYAGAVAEHVLAPAKQLAIRRRRPEDDVDGEDFATVEGRLRAQGRIAAEKGVWVEGDQVSFTYDGGDEESVKITIGREHPPDEPAGHRLRVRLGDPGGSATSLSVGAGLEGADVLRVGADDTITVPTGTLGFAAQTRQMLELYGTVPGKPAYGIGVQDSALYFRSDDGFCWYRGGEHENDAGNPGAGGTLQLRLDPNADLHFGERVRQMLNLWRTRYGIGVQSRTLYFRTGADFCWFRGGVHDNARGNPGGGAVAMRLDDASHLHVSGPLTTGGDTVVNGSLDVTSDLLVSGQSPSVIKARSYPIVKQNAGNAPVTWDETVGGDFDEIYSAFAVLNGFSIWDHVTPQEFDQPTPHLQGLEYIVQHAYVRVVSVAGTTITLRAFCQQSDETREDNNTILATLVVLGRTNP